MTKLQAALLNIAKSEALEAAHFCAVAKESGDMIAFRQWAMWFDGMSAEAVKLQHMTKREFAFYVRDNFDALSVTIPVAMLTKYLIAA